MIKKKANIPRCLGNISTYLYQYLDKNVINLSLKTNEF